MPKENNKIQVDIDTLKKQNVNDLLSIKELYSKLEELGEKTSQIKYIDNTLVKKIKKEFEKLKKTILDENVQLKLTNDIKTINSQLDSKAKQSDLKTLESRMNNFTALSEGSTTGDAELLDGRIGIDGTIHDNIGNAIRSQFNEVFDIDITEGYVIENGEVLTGQYAMADTTVHLNESIDRVAKKFEIKGNTKYKAVGLYQASEWAALYIITDKAGNVLVNYYSDDASSWHTNSVEFTSPSNSKYIYVNGSIEGNSVAVIEPQLYSYKKEAANVTPKWKQDINSLEEDITILKTYKEYKTKEKSSFIDNKIKNIISNARVIADLSKNFCSNNIKKVTESLYGEKGIILTSFLDGEYKFEINVNVNFDTLKKYYLCFKTTRDELIVSKAMRIVMYDNNNALIYDNNTDYNFSYSRTNGWNLYELSNIPNSTIKKIVISMTNISVDNIPYIIWDSIICDRKIKPFVFYCTDNGFINCYDKIAPILKANNMKGCTSISNTTDMTIEQIESLVKNGWDFAIYGMHNFDTIPDWDSFVKNEDNFEALKNGIKASIDGFEDKKIPFPSAYFCRHNLSTPMLLKAVKSNKIDMVRTSADTGLFQNYTIEDMEIPTIGLIDTNLTEVKSKIDYAVKNGFGICVFTHQVVDGGDTSLLNTGTEVFTEFCNYCKAYIDKGELVSYNARDVINNFTNSDIDTVKIREMEYKLSKL